MLPLHHDPLLAVGCIRFHGECFIVLVLSYCCVVVLRVELSATRLSAGFGQPALDYHYKLSPPVGMAGVEPAFLCSQSTRVRRYPTSRRFSQNGRI